jgi:AcrR family transcriptional regulator
MVRAFARIDYSHSIRVRAADLKPRKAPRQQRSLVMVGAILQAAARVLARESLAGFNTNRVAEVAGISVGSLYQYFPNKEALVGALIERAHDDLAAALEQLLRDTEGATLQRTLQQVARLAIGQQYGNPLLAAALDHEEKRLPLQAHQREFGARMLGTVSALLARHAAELAPGLTEAAAGDCLAITKALVEADADGKAPPGPGLQARIVRALYGYLCVPLTAPRRLAGGRPSRARPRSSSPG